MASNVEREIIRQLAGMPDDHPEREFLLNEARKFRRFNSKQGEPPGIQVEKARRRIQILVDKDIGSHPLASEILRENEGTIAKGKHLHGENFVGNLLPVSCRQFGAIINLLRKQQVETKLQLVGLPDVGSLTGVGKERALLVGAMQDLAFVEIIQAPQRGQN